MKLIKKAKEYLEENKEGIIHGCIFAAGIFVGGLAMDKISDVRFGMGLLHLHDVGLFKFFNPDTGVEIGVQEALDIAQKITKELRS